MDTNIVANPGFENGIAAPLNWTFFPINENIPIWSNVSHTGSRSVEISIPGTTDLQSGYPESDLIIAEPFTNYTISAWGKTQNVNGTNPPIVRIAELDKDRNLFYLVDLPFSPGTNDWERKTIEFQTGSNTKYLYIYANIWNGYGNFWLDDVELNLNNTPAPTSTPTPARTPAPTSTPSLTGIFFVATNGNDNNPGTETQPWKTIQKAANTLTAGQTVYVKTGTYKEKITIQNSGSPGKYITFASYPERVATIDGSKISLGDWYGLVNILGKSYIKISGFNIINSDAAGVFVSWDENKNIPSDHINIEKNYIYNSRSSGIQALGQSSNPATNYVIDGNEIVKSQYNGQVNHETITIAENVNGFVISNNIIRDSKTEGIDVKDNVWNGEIYGNDVSIANNVGIYVDAWDHDTGNIKIFKNKVHDLVPFSRSDATGIMLGSEISGSLSGISIYNNLIYNNPGDGITIGWYSKALVKDVSIISNTIYKNGGGVGWTTGGIQIDYNNIQNIIVRNNIVSQNNAFQIRTVNRGKTTIDHNLINGFKNYSNETRGLDFIEADPQFLDPTKSNFHLESTSPAINKGNSTGAPNTDFDGKSRPSGSGHDIGAFES